MKCAHALLRASGFVRAPEQRSPLGFTVRRAPPGVFLKQHFEPPRGLRPVRNFRKAWRAPRRFARTPGHRNRHICSQQPTSERQQPNQPPAGSSEDSKRLRVKRALERVRAELRSIASEHDVLAERISQRFHPYWGSLLKEQSEMSSFGLQVDLYADVYTRRVSCLRHYSPRQYIRSPYDLMLHEL